MPRRLRLLALSVIAIACLVAIATLVFWVWTAVNAGRDPSPILAITLVFAFTIVLYAIVRMQRRNFSAFKFSLTQNLNDHLGEFEVRFSELLASKVEAKPSRELLLEAIGNLYIRAAEKAAKLNDLRDPMSSREAIVLFGASDVQPRGLEVDRFSDDHTNETAFEIFFKGRDAAEKNQVVFYRYVRLFDASNFPGRSKQIREGYISWIKGQVAVIERYGGYILINARRAPRWKAIRSSIVSSDTFIDVLGDGEAGFVVHGRDFAQSQIRSAEAYIKASPSGSGNPFIGRFETSNVSDLKSHLAEMEELHKRIEDGSREQ